MENQANSPVNSPAIRTCAPIDRVGGCHRLAIPTQKSRYFRTFVRVFRDLDVSDGDTV